MSSETDLSKAILTICLGFAFFAVSDALLKLSMANLGLIEALFYHSFFASIALGIYLTFSKNWHQFSSKGILKWQVLRGIMSAIGGLLNLYALQFISLDQFYTIVFSSPIITSLLSIIFLKEQVSWQRWAGIIVGFIGVLIVINPFHMTMNPYGFLCLISAVFFSAASILLRHLNTPKPQLLGFAFIPCLISTVIPLIILISQERGLSPIIHHQTMILSTTGVLSALGAVLVADAFTMAESSTVAPYHYSQMFWGVLLGYILFTDLPSLQTVAGCTLIIGSGLYIVYREHTVRKKQRLIMMNHTPHTIPGKRPKT